MTKAMRSAGFTLIELMTVVVVIAILVAVAYPSYQDHVRKGKRAEGRAALLRIAQVLERNYTDRNTYVTDIAPLVGLAANAAVYSGENPADTTSSYRVTVTAPTAGCPLASCFQLVATPNAPFADADCGNLTLTSTGQRGWSTSGTPSTAALCKW
ncbi:MAG: prepilin-type N-terminal cleavage/methylation domain-containing protein [Burkholderiales bacterium]|nr:prepilin-type N-terminal cleavage/methylation domain-containing protein [Burkholderiales bacterium]